MISVMIVVIIIIITIIKKITIYAHIKKVKRIPSCNIEIMLPDIKTNYRLRMDYIVDYLDYLKKILEIKTEFIDKSSRIKRRLI